MTTQPTNNPVPSESPRDLKFNAGKIDEFVTSLALKYQDRFGTEHYTIEGLRQLAQEAIAAFGWITVDSFQDGATLTLPNQVLRWKLPDGDGEYYRWDGALPKAVPANSTPENSGGIGTGMWLSVGDAVLRAMLASNQGAGMIGTTSGQTVQASLNTLEARTYGWVSLLEFIPEALHQYLKDLDQSNTHIPSCSDYLDAATKYCEENKTNLFIPAGYYMLTREWGLPVFCKVSGAGMHSTYLLASDKFSGTRMVHCDYEGQNIFSLSNLQIHGLNAPNKYITGLHVGSCRNSNFEYLLVTDTYLCGLRLQPNGKTPLDVENFLIQKIWTLNTFSPLLIKTHDNQNAANGNITDGTVRDCQWVSWDGASANSHGLSAGGIPIEVRSGTSKVIYGVTIERCFTATVKNAHINMVTENTSKGIYNCRLVDISGESQNLNGSLDTMPGQPAMLIDGVGVQDNLFDNVQCGKLGDGVAVTDAQFNTFLNMTFDDNAIVGNNNVWIALSKNSNGNRFFGMRCGNILQQSSNLTANIYHEFLLRKIQDNGTDNQIEFTYATSEPALILSRGAMFKASNGKLVNFPDSGGDAIAWSWALQPDGSLRLRIPASTGVSSKTLPFTPVNAKLGGMVVYTIRERPAEDFSLIFKFGDTEVPITQKTVGVTGSVSVVASASTTGSIMIISGGNATADILIDIHDIAISANKIKMRKTIKSSMYAE